MNELDQAKELLQKVLLIIPLLFLAGCDKSVEKPGLNWAEHVCTANNGIRALRITHSTVMTYCVNGARFIKNRNKLKDWEKNRND